jgi:hypothetical protein
LVFLPGDQAGIDADVDTTRARRIYTSEKSLKDEGKENLKNNVLKQALAVAWYN